MCGVAGCVVAPGTEVDTGALQRMAAALSHRGPDDTGTAVVGNVGLAHTRLAILDPTPAGHEPLHDEETGWWLTYNGEAFNHMEIRARLPIENWRSRCDAETVLRALGTLGEDAVPLANGLYAYAALDPAGRLLLVRDRFGVKPLYVARRGREWWFASEMRALLAAGIEADVDREILAHAVDRGWVNGRPTPLRGIENVLPGTIVSIDTTTLEATESRWYDAADAVDPERARRLAKLDRGAAGRALEAELRASVSRRLLSDVPLGVMCSGGVDSSVIAALAAEENPKIEAFTASIADQPENDEIGYGRLVAGHLGITLHEVPLDSKAWQASLVKCVRHLEMPMLHPGSVPMHHIAALARRHGVKVLLSGEGADELFGGYSYLHVRERAQFQRRATLRRRIAARLRALAQQNRPPVSQPSIVEPGHGPSPRVNEHERALAAAARSRYGQHPAWRADMEGGLLSDLGTYLPHLLNRQDKMTMMDSIETRVPFLDPDVVSLALNLPLEYRLEPWPKGVLGQLARRRVPVEAVERPKMGFGFDTGRYFAEAARPEFLGDGRLRELLEIGAGEWADALPTFGAHDPLLLHSGEIWCRAILDGQTDEEIEAALWFEPPSSCSS